MTDAAQQLAGFIAKYDPKIAAHGQAILDRMTKRLPQANRLVYDNYNALAIGFCPTERTSDMILSIAFFPRWVSLFLTKVIGLPDPGNILKGAGTTVRHIVINDPAELDRPDIAGFIDHAIAHAEPPLPATGDGRLIIKSISAKQRPRRPV
jgi:hypothetical protein